MLFGRYDLLLPTMFHLNYKYNLSIFTPKFFSLDTEKFLFVDHGLLTKGDSEHSEQDWEAVPSSD